MPATTTPSAADPPSPGVATVDVAVVIPAHNTAEYLAQTLDTVAAQTVRPAEVVVVDDRSTDGTGDIAAGHAIGAKVVRGTFGTAAKTRHAGVEASSAAWIAFLDSDDLWDNDYLESAMRCIEAAPDDVVACVSHRRDLVVESGDIEPTPRMKLDEGTAVVDMAAMRRLVPTRPLNFSTSGQVVRRASYVEVGGFDGEHVQVEDVELMLRLAKRGPWAYVDEPKWTYRRGRPGNLSGARARGVCDSLKAHLKHRDAYDSPAWRAAQRYRAERALGMALRTDDAAHRAMAFELALPLVSWPKRQAFRLRRMLKGGGHG
ncbi:MAG: glycosyltransferase family A protein [Planctomycetota bacterium]